MAFSLKNLLEGNGFEGLSGAAADAMQRHAAQSQEKLTTLLVDVLGSADAVVQRNLVTVRAHRQAEKVALKQLKEVSKAVDHLKQTGNPMPFYRVTGDLAAASRFCSKLGVPLPEEKDSIWKIK